MDAPSPTTINQAAETILAGGVLVAPTETRYGLLARADRQAVLEKIYALKRRPVTQPTALMVANRSELSRYGEMTPQAERLAGDFLPGPLTLVLKARENWPPPRVVDGKIGLRCSSSPLVAALLKATACDLTATSANVSGMGDLDEIAAIAEALGEGVDLYLDGGPLTGPTSTVVACDASGVKILREGAISAKDINRTVGADGQ